MRSTTQCIAIAAVLASFLLATSALSQPVPVSSQSWPTYHATETRVGVNPFESMDGANINLIWTFPRLDVSPYSEEETIVEMGDPGTVLGPGWDNLRAFPTPPQDYYGGDTGNPFGYYWIRAYTEKQISDNPGLESESAWPLPSGLPAGQYIVEVWGPSSGGGRINAKVARYYVAGQGPYKVDQRQGGGWIRLRETPFDLVPGDTVTLENVIDSTDPEKNPPNNSWDEEELSRTIVVADAVRFVPSTGMEIYTSPAAGTIAGAPVAWIGTIEDPGASQAPAGVDDLGAIYCVDSRTDGDANAVGRAIWRYPHGGAFESRAIGNPVRLDREHVEGPIGRIGTVGGIYSSPTVVELPGGQQAVVFGGMDGQVYCLDAATGALMWKGPGVTISETKTADGTRGGWNTVGGRTDAFGGTFLHSPVVGDSASAQKITYDVGATDSDVQVDVGREEKGHMYAIYAWIPGRAPGEPPRTYDALYHITYYDPAKDENKGEDWVRIDQRDPNDPGDLVDPEPRNLPEDPHVGRWVRVGGSYWNPTSIELSTETQMEVNRRQDPSGTMRVVVADAIMVVPADIGPFSYSTVACDGSRVYIGSTTGRVYAFPIRSAYKTGFESEHAGKLEWTFPQVQSENPPTLSDEKSTASASPIGAVVSAPACSIRNNRVVVSSMDGKVYAIKSDSGELDWSAPAGSSALPGEIPVPGETTGSEGFSSSPVIFEDMYVYAASVGGRLYKFNLQKMDNQVIWEYPDVATSDDDSTAPPLSAFRFSTPAVEKDRMDASKIRIYCGTSGGQLLGFVDQMGSVRLMNDTDTGGFEFANPEFYLPIQGSVAVDQQNIYIPTMGSGDGEDDGGLWWVNKDHGLAADSSGTNLWVYSGWSYIGTIFSSPALANEYVYVGSGNGRLHAFSDAAFGGAWVGGGSGPPGRRSESPTAKSLQEVPQVDIFTWPVYKSTLDAALAAYPAPAMATEPLSTFVGPNFFADADWGTDPTQGHKKAFPSATSPRELYLEWGEDICLIAWNLPALQDIAGGGNDSGLVSSGKTNSVTFRFTNAGPGSSAGGTMSSRHAQYLFEYIADDPSNPGTDKEFTCALAIVEIRANTARPPAPGIGWRVSASVRTTGGTAVPHPGVVPLLTGAAGAWTPQISTSTVGSQTISRYDPQPVGINNPLAIRDEGGGVAGPVLLGWPRMPVNPDGTLPGNRDEPTAHFNGNSAIEGGSWVDTMPHVYLGLAKHGSNSRVGKLGVMDRSAIGLRVTNRYDGVPVRDDLIKTLRIQPADLRWIGGNNAVLNYLPWDYPPYWSFGTYESRLQRDYPDISKREQRFQKSPDNNDPAVEATELQPAIPFDLSVDGAFYDQSTRLRPDFMDSWAEVPMFQPANMTNPGYGAEVIAFLDNNRNSRFDGGNVIAGRPSTYVETHRRFAISVDVPPDYHMVIDQPLTIDIIGPDKAMAPHGLGFGLDPISLQSWYKQFSVRNLGNVNLYNIKIAKELSNGVTRWWLNLPAEDVNPFYPISGQHIVSSFDGWDPNWGAAVGNEPFITRQYGYTLSKSRVGDVMPMELRIPDARKCEQWSIATSSAIQSVDPEWFLKQGNTGILPSVSVMVPLTQPSGSYHQLVPVFADMNTSGRWNVLDVGTEPYTDPTFRLNVMVAEDRMTGGSTPGSAPQIDSDPVPGQPRIVSGNAQPAAWRDPATGNVHMFWSSNLPSSGSQPTGNTPWYLAYATLPYDKQDNQENWQYTWKLPAAASPRWWMSGPGEFPDPSAFPWPTPMPSGAMLDTIKHSAPWAAVVRDSKTDFDTKKVWLFWQGQVDAVDPVTSKIEREYRIFYTPATDGVVTGNETSVFSFARDLSQPKMNPKAIAYHPSVDPAHEHIWLLWHGGSAGRWNIFGNLNMSPADSHNREGWGPDVVFPTPSCLVSVSDPSPIHRPLAQSSAGGPGAAPADYFLDVAYTGVSKYDQSSDIILTRYAFSADPQNMVVSPIPMPRVYGEEALRDTKRNVYTSKHLSWIRPPVGGMIDIWELPAPGTVNIPDSPFIRVRFPSGVTSGGVTLPAGTRVSGTDGSTMSPGGGIVTPGKAIAPEIDKATGVYTYTHTGDAGAVLGQMLVDFSAGIIRFTKPLPSDARVEIDYMPQARRMTRGQEKDGSPLMFIEKTPMSNDNRNGPAPNPGLVLPSDTYSGPAPTDRMWLFWRKQASGVQSSTVYYKTYRIAATLPQPVELDKSGRPKDNITVANALGPCEVSWDGNKIYFSAVDERYPGLGSYPGPIKIDYTAKALADGSGGGATSVVIDTLTWEEELSETALRTRQSVNEGQVCAFADTNVDYTKIWVFWSSTRAGQSDLYYQTISPNFRALY